MYKVDFEAERKSREELNDERLKLQEKLTAVEQELQSLKLANQMSEMQLRHGYAAARHTVGVAEEMPVADVYQRRIAQEQHLAAQGGAAAAAPTATVAPVATPPTNTATHEVSLMAGSRVRFF